MWRATLGPISAPGYAKNWPQLLCGVLTLHNCCNYMGLPNYTLCSFNYAKKGITHGIEKLLTTSWPTWEKQKYSWWTHFASCSVTLLSRFPPLLDKIRLEPWVWPSLMPTHSSNQAGAMRGLGVRLGWGGKGTFQLSSPSHNGSTVIVLYFRLFMQG